MGSHNWIHVHIIKDRKWPLLLCFHNNICKNTIVFQHPTKLTLWSLPWLSQLPFVDEAKHQAFCTCTHFPWQSVRVQLSVGTCIHVTFNGIRYMYNCSWHFESTRISNQYFILDQIESITKSYGEHNELPSTLTLSAARNKA